MPDRTNLKLPFKVKVGSLIGVQFDDIISTGVPVFCLHRYISVKTKENRLLIENLRLDQRYEYKLGGRHSRRAI
jgi:hypothetical protein